MGMIYRKQYTRPLPPGAEIAERDGKRIARWRLRNGTLRTGEVVDGRDGKPRVRGRSPSYNVRYRNATGHVIDVSTKCKDEVAARAFLARLERQAELVRSGVLTPAEADAAGHSDLPFKDHVVAYEKHLRAKGCEPRRISMVRARLERLARECKFGRLNTLSAERVERWLVTQQEAGLSASTRNSYRESLVGFGNWCRRTGRLTHNPFADLPRADANSDRRHQRRALTEPELLRLLKVARLRPLAEYGRIKVANEEPASSKKSRATCVSNHSKPATDYHLKTGHFGEALIRPLGSSVSIFSGLEDRNGESTRNGEAALDHRALEAGLVASADRSDAGHSSRDGVAVRTAGV